MELPRHFFAEAKYEKRNLPPHLRRQLPSAEANYEGCLLSIISSLHTKTVFLVMARLIALILHFPVFSSTGTMMSFILKYAAAFIKYTTI